MIVAPAISTVADSELVTSRSSTGTTAGGLGEAVATGVGVQRTVSTYDSGHGSFGISSSTIMGV